MEEHSDHTTALNSLGDTLKSDFDNLRQQQTSRLNQLSSLMASLEDCTQSASTEAEQFDTMANTALDKLNSVKSDLCGGAEKEREHAQQIEQLRLELENADREKSGLVEKIQRIESDQTQLNAVQSELSARDEALETLQREFDQLRQAHDREHQELTRLSEEAGAGDAAQQALEAAQSELATVTASLQALQSAHDELQQAQENRQRELESTRERADSAEQSLEKLAEENAANAESSKQHDGQVAALTAELESLRAEFQGADEGRAELQSTLESLRAEKIQSDATQEGLKSELMSVQRELEAVREKYREGLSTEAALALRQQVTNTVAQVAELQDEIERTRGQSKKSVLALQLAEAIDEAERAEEENDKLKQELGLLREGASYPDAHTEVDNDGSKAPPALVKTTLSPEDELRRIRESAQDSSHGPKRVIGQILLDAGVISAEQLEQALSLQKSNPQQHMGAILTELGLATEEAVSQARASQCGVEFIRLQDDTINPEAASLISERLANQHNCIPISATERHMVLAVTNPMDLLAIEDVERFTNRKVDVVVGTVPEIKSAIARYYWEPE